jgi:hypothetical protein
MRLYSLGQLSNSEKSDILNKHKSVYNGYRAMHPEISNNQPIYVQDFANDKDGVTIDNLGNVSSYSNKIYMKESKEDSCCSKCGGIMSEGQCNECGWKGGELDEISPKDLEKGKKYKFKSPSFEDDIEFEDEINYPHGGSKHYSFKGDKAGHLLGDKTIEDFVSHLNDTDEGIYDVEDLHKGDEFDYIKGDANLDEDHMDAYHPEEGPEYEPMVSAFADELDEVTGPSPLYSEVDFEPYEFKSNGPNFAPHGVKEDEDEFETASNKMRRGVADIEDIDWEDIEDMDNNDDDSEVYDEDEFETASNKIKTGRADIEDIDWEEIDEDLRESFISQKTKINEMMDRIKKF